MSRDSVGNDPGLPMCDCFWMRPTIVVFTGLPGTGKSTLSESLGRRLHTPVFAGDWLLGSMKPAHEQIATMDQAAYDALYESVLTSLLSRQLMLGQSGIADCVLADPAIERLAEKTNKDGPDPVRWTRGYAA